MRITNMVTTNIRVIISGSYHYYGFIFIIFQIMAVFAVATIPIKEYTYIGLIVRLRG